MERWLTRPRVMVALCAVLLLASLNRRDPMVYAMFLFLSTLSTLGFLLPWLSLRGMTVKVSTAGALPIDEGQSGGVQIELTRTAWWPAFMVEVRIAWRWAGRETGLQEVVPVVRRGRSVFIGHSMQFTCRGAYELAAIELASGFPLGLIRARRVLPPPVARIVVLPKAADWLQDLPSGLAEDAQGDHALRRLGHSMELGALRPYEAGEPLGRINWRASSRLGEIVIQHFQQSAQLQLRMLVALPSAPQAGVGTSAAEQAVRCAVGLCMAARRGGNRLRVFVPPQDSPLHEVEDIRAALAVAAPVGDVPRHLLTAMAQAAGVEEMLVLVLGAGEPPQVWGVALVEAGWAERNHLVVIVDAAGSGAASAVTAQTAQTRWRLQGFSTMVALA